MFVPSERNYVKFPSYYSFQENVGCILKPLLTMISCTPTHRSDMKFPALKLYKCNKCPKNCRRAKKCQGLPCVMWWPGISRTSFYSWLCRDSSLSSELSISSSSSTLSLVSESPIAIWIGLYHLLTITFIQAIFKNHRCKILYRYHFSLAAVPYHHSSHCWKNEAKDDELPRDCYVSIAWGMFVARQ